MKIDQRIQPIFGGVKRADPTATLTLPEDPLSPIRIPHSALRISKSKCI